MRILLLSFYFPPTGGPGAIRWANFLHHFQKNASVDVITVHNENHPVIDHHLQELIPDNFRIHYVKSPERYIRKGTGGFLRIGHKHNLFLPDSKFWWINKAKRIASQIGEFDVIVSTSPPFSSIVAASAISDKMGIPFIADMRDSYLLDPNPPKQFLLWKQKKKHIFKKSMLKASAVVAVNPVVATEMRYRTLQRIPVEYIPNGVNIADNSDYQSKTITMAGRFFGNLNFPENLFIALTYLKDEGYRMRFLGPADKRYYEWTKKYDLEDIVEITGSIPYKQIMGELPKSEVLFTYLDERPGNSRQIQSKIWDYLGSGRPIVAVVPKLSPAAEVIEKYNAGIVVPDDPQSIAKAIREFPKGDVPKPSDISWQDRAYQYIDLIERTIQSK